MKTFNELGLKKDICKILNQLHFFKPLEVQEKVIPVIAQGKNVVFQSQTGSGKTLAYAIPYLSKLNSKQGLQMLILLPTRELCQQVSKEISRITERMNINVGTLFGGRSLYGDQKTYMKKNQIMVATPGRVIQHINEKHIKAGNVKYIVYDESDQMFDTGFYDDCCYLLGRISRDAQIVLASATLTDDVKNFMDNEIVEYDFLQIGDVISKKIIQEKIYCSKEAKHDILIRLLNEKKFKKCLIFANTKIKVAEITHILEEHNFQAQEISSSLTQKLREQTLQLFKQGRINILVATDVAARGLHIEKVDGIVNFDMPTRLEFYVHRIGRTGRNKKDGYSISLICPEDEKRMEDTEDEYNIHPTNVTDNSN